MDKSAWKISIGGGCGTGKGATSSILGDVLNVIPQSAGSHKRAVAREWGLTLEQLLIQAPKIAPDLDKQTDEWIKMFGNTWPSYVFEGRLAYYFLPRSKKFLLICDLNERARRVASREKISINEAYRKIVERDSIDTTNYFNLYGISDFADPRWYDLTIDTTSISPEEVAQKIIAYMEAA